MEEHLIRGTITSVEVSLGFPLVSIQGFKCECSICTLPFDIPEDKYKSISTYPRARVRTHIHESEYDYISM